MIKVIPSFSLVNDNHSYLIVIIINIKYKVL